MTQQTNICRRSSQRARTCERVWGASSPNRSPARNHREHPLRPLSHHSNTGFITITTINIIMTIITTITLIISMLNIINSSTTSIQTTGCASPLDRDSQSPLPPSVAEAKNRSIILKQEDFVKKKEEPARKQQEDVVKKKEKMEKTSSRSGLSCLRDVCQKKTGKCGNFEKLGGGGSSQIPLLL